MNKINFGGFPPIIKITDEAKKKREFKKEKIYSEPRPNINILNIKNILANIKK